jgi:hypothetical protein
MAHAGPEQVLAIEMAFFQEPALAHLGFIREHERLTAEAPSPPPRPAPARAGLAVVTHALSRAAAHGAPLRKAHACVFAVLTMESAPIDPRL